MNYSAFSTGTFTATNTSRKSATPTSSTTTTTSLLGGEGDVDPPFFDVLVVGGGVVGCSLARLLNVKLPSLRVGLLEARDYNPPAPPPDGGAAGPVKEDISIPHPRSYALSPQSLQILGDTTLQQLQFQHPQLGYYTSMQVWQANSPASLTFSTRDLNVDPLLAPPFLGAVVEDAPLVASLWHQLMVPNSQTTCFTNTHLKSIHRPDNDEEEDSLVLVTTNQGDTLATALLVGADGGNSWVRQTSGISRMGTDYNQHALTFTVELAGSNHQRAFQRFLPDGSILALLPTRSTKYGVIVWSTSPAIVQHWKQQQEHNDDNESGGGALLVQHLNDLLSQGPQRVPPLLERDPTLSSSLSFSSTMASNLLYGAERVLDTIHYGLAVASHYPNPKFMAPPRISRVASPKFSFPLSCYQAQSYTTRGNRIALVGDAAHTVHPMAGQGLNLGLGDVQQLVNSIEKATLAGMDVSTFLQEDYGTSRRRSISLSLAGIHSLQRLFGNQQDTALQHVKTLGLNLLQNVTPLRRQLVQAAAYGI
jgi:ubiquinone biosynthesis monooxygenase Coq6